MRYHLSVNLGSICYVTMLRTSLLSWFNSNLFFKSLFATIKTRNLEKTTQNPDAKHLAESRQFHCSN